MAPASSKLSAPDFTAARFSMVESQIRPNKVRNEKLLDVIGALPREIFVPPAMAGIAYIDEDLQVTPNRYLLEPMVLARLLEVAHIQPNERVLDIAPATGYSTAVIASLAKEVVAVESDASLKMLAVSNLGSIQIINADVQVGTLTEGYKSKAPYDVILINGGVEFVPEALTAQLAEGGRLFVIVRQYGVAHAAHTGEARVYEKIRGQISHRSLFDANVKLLPGFSVPKTFTF